MAILSETRTNNYALIGLMNFAGKPYVTLTPAFLNSLPAEGQPVENVIPNSHLLALEFNVSLHPNKGQYSNK
jgi:hypothetical protein